MWKVSKKEIIQERKPFKEKWMFFVFKLGSHVIQQGPK